MDLWLAFTLLVACLLRGHVCGSSNLEDILIGQAGLADAKGETYLQSNVTNLQKNKKQDDLMLTLLQSSDTTALEQLDQLSLVTRYAGTGYNLIKGNPEGDFSYGGVDPGIKTTHVIFSQT